MDGRQPVEPVDEAQRDLTGRVTAIEPTWKDYLRGQDQVRGTGMLVKLIWEPDWRGSIDSRLDDRPLRLDHRSVHQLEIANGILWHLSDWNVG